MKVKIERTKMETNDLLIEFLVVDTPVAILLIDRPKIDSLYRYRHISTQKISQKIVKNSGCFALLEDK